MAAKLGAILTRCALGPVSYAGGCIMASKVPDGLRELGPEGLWGGLVRGIGEVAAAAGVAARDVEGLLPMAALDAKMRELGAAQQAASAAWQLHAGHLGGLMAGIADLTVDGRAPDVGLCLERLARKVSRDKPLSVPLLGLADAVRAWTDAVEAACAALDDEGTGGRLAAAYRRRKRIRAAKIAAAVLVPVAIAGLVARVAVVRARVAAALDAADPCAVIAIAPGDREGASGDQQAAIVARIRLCEDARVAEERRRLEAAAKAAAIELEKATKAERAARCAALAEHAAAGRVEESDAATAGEAAAIVERAVRRKLVEADLGPDDPKLPCAGTPAEAALGAVWAKAVTAAPWAKAPALSPAARKAIAADAGAVPRWAKGVAAKRATDAAKKALVSGDAGDLARAAAACDLVRSLAWPAGPQCERVGQRGD